MLTIERKNGDSYVLDNYMRIKDFDIGFPDIDTQKATIEGVDGYMDRGTRYEGRILTIEADMLKVPAEFEEGRNQIFRIFKSKEEFYLIDSKEPYRRWVVKMASGFNMPRETPLFTSFTIELESRLSYAESIDQQTQTFTSSSFTVTNNGDSVINPRSWNTPMTITLRNIRGGIRLENTTNGSVWEYEVPEYISTSIDDWEQGSLGQSTGSEIDSDTRIRTKDFLRVNPGATYHLEIDSDFRFLLHEYDESLQSIENHGFNQILIFTTKEDTKVIRLGVRKYPDGQDITPDEIENVSFFYMETTVVIDGVKSEIGDKSIFRETNGGLISLEEGDNDFEVEGMGSNTEIEFEFKEYTL
ncbi:phage tail domain-containing protein [Alteribacillus sp. JSM 102045]|uniref:phage tail domain-containing protein n=1 Tax=Alteribacillus sp. JSM 102045 TaxID=1562101 RepID=UPI0035C1273D